MIIKRFTRLKNLFTVSSNHLGSSLKDSHDLLSDMSTVRVKGTIL